MPTEEDIARLRHMLDAARDAVGFAEGRARGDLDTDRQLTAALLRELEVLGEASKRVSDEFRTEHPELPWKKMAKTRDRLIHGYDNLDHDIVWDIVTEHLPEVVAALEGIIEAGEGE